MKELFNDIRNTEDLEGILVFSVEGKVIYQEFLYAPTEEINNQDFWSGFISLLDGIREAELLFEKSKVYIREMDIGYLIIITGVFAPSAKIRLYCDILIPSLKSRRPSKRLKRIFKRNK